MLTYTTNNNPEQILRKKLSNSVQTRFCLMLLYLPQKELCNLSSNLIYSKLRTVKIAT
jgi:hypothetical protein